jgi:murein DD-endopeptidase MepM/ murein hydrolase activator NlpD
VQQVDGRRSTLPPLTSVLAALVVLALLASSLLPGAARPAADAQERSSTDIARELDEVEREAGSVEAGLREVQSDIQLAVEELAAIGARLEDARGRLVAAEGQVALGEAALEEAEAEREEAIAAHELSEARLAQTEQELAREEGILVEHLVQTFKYGTAGAQRGAAAIEVLRRAQDPNEFAVGLKQLQTVADVQESTVQSVFQLRQDRAEQAEDAARASGRAAQAAADASATLRVLEELRAEAAAVAVEIADDEAAQAQVLASLRADEAQRATVLEQVQARQAVLTTELREQRQREEEARRRAEEEARRRAEEEARRRAAAEAAAAAAGGSNGSSSGGSSAGSSAGSGGGSAGGGRLSTPGAGGGPSLDGLVCPVQGAIAGRDFSNDWGYPRSGGRTHQGNDIFAARGTPIVAVADGEVIRWNPPWAPTSLGGITITYRTADGSEWYNAHLDTIAEGIEPGSFVARGQVIGTVGNTGNARTTPPHNHLGRRYGGVWVNPWPTIAPVC